MDLLFKNSSYFFSTYFNAPIYVYILTYVICCIILFLYINKRYKINKQKAVPVSIVLSVYFTVVVIVTLLCVNRIGTRGVILNPFYGFSKILSERNVHFLRGIVSNIILYVPYGMICFIFKNRVRKSNNLFIVVPSTFLFSFFIESLQYIFSVGYFEIEDIWCNVLGGLIGSSVIALLMLVTNQLKNIIKGEKYDIQ